MTANSIEFSFEYMGKTFQCFYALKDSDAGTIHVSTPWGPKDADLGGGEPLVVARLLAGELARDARQR
ncbi:MAG TPA: hypothetical protein P5337_12065 [Aestuariivirga sp.]|nr:hypothetical protein [Aestuariivirga sp.]